MASPATDGTTFPMPAKTFLAGNYLRRADIVLMRGSSLFSRTIRYATKSPFSHAALVFVIPQRDKGFERTFLIEAVPKGVDISDLKSRVLPEDGHAAPEMAFLRLQRPWFGTDLQSLVRGRMLDYIKAGYDWRTVLGIAWSVLRGSVLPNTEFSKEFQKALRSAYDRKGRAPANFICSGLVQYGYLAAIHDHVTREGAAFPDDADDLAVLNQQLKNRLPDELLSGAPATRSALLATTPEDISRAPQLVWKYAIVRGQVHAVASRDAAVACFDSRDA